jgi:hypothetical protein
LGITSAILKTQASPRGGCVNLEGSLGKSCKQLFSRSKLESDVNPQLGPAEVTRGGPGRPGSSDNVPFQVHFELGIPYTSDLGVFVVLLTP